MGLFRWKVASTLLSTGMVIANPVTVIQPCPESPSTVSDITVTEQYQTVSTCVPTSTCIRDRCTTEYPYRTFQYVSTVVPCAWDGTTASSTTITNLDQTVVAKRSAVTTTIHGSEERGLDNRQINERGIEERGWFNRYRGWFGGFGRLGGHGGSDGPGWGAPVPVPAAQTIYKDYVIPFRFCGPHIIPGYPGNGLAQGDHPQAVTVTECKWTWEHSDCVQYVESWSPVDGPTSTKQTVVPVSTVTVVPTSGTYTITVQQTIPSQTLTSGGSTWTIPQSPWYWHTTTTCHPDNGPGWNTISLTVTVTTTITMTVPPSTIPPTTSIPVTVTATATATESTTTSVTASVSTTSFSGSVGPTLISSSETSTTSSSTSVPSASLLTARTDYTTVTLPYTGTGIISVPTTITVNPPSGESAGAVIVYNPNTYSSSFGSFLSSSQSSSTSQVAPTSSPMQSASGTNSQTGQYVTTTLPWTGTASISAAITSTIAAPSDTASGTVIVLTPPVTTQSTLSLTASSASSVSSASLISSITSDSPALTATSVASGSSITISAITPISSAECSPIAASSVTVFVDIWLFGPCDGNSTCTASNTTYTSTSLTNSSTTIEIPSVSTPTNSTNAEPESVMMTTSTNPAFISSNTGSVVSDAGTDITDISSSSIVGTPTGTESISVASSSTGETSDTQTASFMTSDSGVSSMPSVTSTFLDPGAGAGSVGIVVVPSWVTITSFGTDSVVSTTTLAAPSGFTPGTVEVIMPASYTTVTTVVTGTATAVETSTIALPSDNLPGTVEVMIPATFSGSDAPTDTTDVPTSTTFALSQSSETNTDPIVVEPPSVFVTYTGTIAVTPTATRPNVATCDASSPPGIVCQAVPGASVSCGCGIRPGGSSACYDPSTDTGVVCATDENCPDNYICIASAPSESTSSDATATSIPTESAITPETIIPVSTIVNGTDGDTFASTSTILGSDGSSTTVYLRGRQEDTDTDTPEPTDFTIVSIEPVFGTVPDIGATIIPLITATLDYSVLTLPTPSFDTIVPTITLTLGYGGGTCYRVDQCTSATRRRRASQPQL